MSYNDLRKGRVSVIEQDYFVTFTTVNRKPYFQNVEAANIVARTIHYHESIEPIAWVVMPDHVHLLFTLKSGELGDAIKILKGRSSREINKAQQGFRWAKSYFEHALRKEEVRIDIARYIVANPLKANLVKSLANYPWWNTAWL